MKNYKHEWTLELPKLATFRNPHRNLCVQIQRSPEGNYHAVLIDLEEFCGEGSTGGIAIDDLIENLKQVAAEIQRESSLEGLLARRLRYDHRLRWIDAKPEPEPTRACQHEIIDEEGQRIWCPRCESPERRDHFKQLENAPKGVP